MKNKFNVVIILTITLSFIVFKVTSLSAQQLLGDTLQHRVSDLENRLFEIKTVQTHVITSLNSANEQNKNLLAGFGAMIAALIIIQSFVTIRQSLREKDRDLVENAGIKQVSEIMNVVKMTLSSRLDSEKQAREEAKSSREKLETVQKDLRDLFQFFEAFQSNIQTQRIGIEDSAVRLAQVPRHEFRLNLTELDSFARQFDIFTSQFEALDKSHHEFSAEVFYIRGIASHYANNPQDAKRYLERVPKLVHPNSVDLERPYKRRLANTYYYLGIIALNFGFSQDAIDFFNDANSLDPERTDFLTKIVTAESYIMKGSDKFDKAKEILADVDEGLNRKRETERHLASVYVRLASRTSLIRANMAILNGDVSFGVSEKLEKVCEDDPLYYFATATLAQIYTIQNKVDEAQNLFRTAHENIERSGDLRTVTEVRSQILLLMVASLCCPHDIKDKKRADEYLDKAESLRSSLPKIDSQECTVFSPLSKLNEKSDIIYSHIELIRKGKVLTNDGRQVNVILNLYMKSQ